MTSGQAAYSRRAVFAAACLGMLLFGIVMTTLGSVLPPLVVRFGVGKAAAGTLLSVLSLGVLAGSLVFGPVVDRYGYRWLLVTCAALVLAGLEGLAFAPTVGWLRAAVALTGFGGGILNGATNALVADVRPEGRGAGLSLLGVFFGIGACGVPFALGFLLEVVAYDAVVAGIGGLVLVPLAFFLLIAFPAPKQARGFPLREVLGLVRQPALLLMGAMLFLQSGIEMVAGGWTTTYAQEVLSVASEDAVFFLSLFWGGMIAARLLLGGALRRLAPGPVLAGALVVAGVGVGALLSADGVALAGAASFVLGAGLAATFPVVLGMAGDRYARLSGSAFSILLVMALTGGSIFPYVAGVMGEAYGLRASFGLIPAALVVLGGLLWLTVRRLREQPAVAVVPAPDG